MTLVARDAWTVADQYEPYVGRWSRLIAARLIDLVAPEPDREWADIGCGTGALTEAIIAAAAPASIIAVEPSAAYLAAARARLGDAPVEWHVGDAAALPIADGAVDYVVSGLVLNFVTDPAGGLAEMVRACRSGGCVAAYVWDYAEGMQMMRYFWDAAVALDPAAAPLDEAARFPLCRPEPLAGLFRGAGLVDVQSAPIDVPTVFTDFDDFWTPFLGGQAPAPGYCASLTDEARTRLRERLRSQLPVGGDGSVALTARAWAVQGCSP